MEGGDGRGNERLLGWRALGTAGSGGVLDEAAGSVNGRRLRKRDNVWNLMGRLDQGDRNSWPSHKQKETSLL